MNEIFCGFGRRWIWNRTSSYQVYNWYVCSANLSNNWVMKYIGYLGPTPAPPVTLATSIITSLVGNSQKKPVFAAATRWRGRSKCCTTHPITCERVIGKSIELYQANVQHLVGGFNPSKNY